MTDSVCRAASRTLEQTDPIVALLATAPSVGPLTASVVVSTIDDVTRFPSAHQFEAYLGLVPGERSSGEKRRIGRITKAGNSRARHLLVKAGWRLLRAKSPETAALRAWGLKIAARRGNRIAAVALARRPAGILYAMWRDNTPYTATRRAAPSRALRPEERTTVLTVLHEPRFLDLAPAEEFATLLDEGIYHCSERTMYRVLAAQCEARPPGAAAPSAVHRPELLATAPNQLWSWDITKLKGPASSSAPSHAGREL